MCLWVNQEEFTNRQQIYQRTGNTEQANRILPMTYDDHGNFSNTCRYVLDSETEEIQEILLSHVPEEQRSQHQYTLEIETRHLLTTGPLNQISLNKKAELA